MQITGQLVFSSQLPVIRLVKIILNSNKTVETYLPDTLSACYVIAPMAARQAFKLPVILSGNGRIVPYLCLYLPPLAMKEIRMKIYEANVKTETAIGCSNFGGYCWNVGIIREDVFAVEVKTKDQRLKWICMQMWSRTKAIILIFLSAKHSGFS